MSVLYQNWTKILYKLINYQYISIIDTKFDIKREKYTIFGPFLGSIKFTVLKAFMGMVCIEPR